MTENENISYVLVGNVPFKFHSVDLRSFFSQFVEAEAFECFHFRHRPEVLMRKSVQQVDISEKANDFIKGKTTCCVVMVKKEYVKEIVETYNGQNWTDKDGKLCAQKAVLSRIVVKNYVGYKNVKFKTRKEERNDKREKIEFDMDDLLKLSELHPPSFMPNGNVGTSLKSFIHLIRTCQLPPHVIKKLGLKFPGSRSKHLYGSVRFDYVNHTNKGDISLCNEENASMGSDDNPHEMMSNESLVDQLVTDNQTNVATNDAQNDHILKTSKSSTNNAYQNTQSTNLGNFDGKNTNELLSDEQNNKLHDVDGNDSLSDTESEPEDWERHEALHDDVDCQARTKERLFENKIELKWEKGGSGLVFYTDAAYWDSLSGDFDEQTADDWDINMSIYEKGGYGDRHSQALMDMRYAEERQFAIDNSQHASKIGDFEKHTKGFGSRVMKSHGWSEGSSLGSSQIGITEPIPNEGQPPHCKTGLGYFGTKLDRHAKRRQVDKEVIISTVFDDRENEKASTPRQSAGPFTLKYRRKMTDSVGHEHKYV